MNKHFLYRHVRLDKNEVFYIGIGTKSEKIYNTFKSIYNRAFSKQKRNNYWNKIVNKTKYEVEILLESDDYEFIKEKEREFIKLYGRRDIGLGTLVNMTDGGDGILGSIQSLNTRKKISEAHKGKKIDKEHFIKMQKGQILYNSKGVLQYDIYGNFIKEWQSATEASRNIKVHPTAIRHCVQGKVDRAGGFIWISKEKDKPILFKIEISNKIKSLIKYYETKKRLKDGINLNNKPIYCINIKNNIKKQYNKIIDCSNDLKIKSFYICRLLKSGKIYKNKYKFEYIIQESQLSYK